MDYTLDEDSKSASPPPQATAYTDDYRDYGLHEDNGTFWQLFWEDHNRTLVPDNASDFFYHDFELPDPSDAGGRDTAAHNAASPGVHATLQCSLCWMMVGLWACCLLLLFRRVLLPPFS